LKRDASKIEVENVVENKKETEEKQDAEEEKAQEDVNAMAIDTTPIRRLFFVLKIVVLFFIELKYSFAVICSYEKTENCKSMGYQTNR
jgi:hypothetical protein